MKKTEKAMDHETADQTQQDTAPDENCNVETPSDESFSIEQQLEEKSKQCDELLDRLQRTMAEFDNFRKRTSKEKSAMYSDGQRDVIEKLLPVIDNFERALHAVPESDQEGTFYKGIEMILRQLSDTLDELDVTVIPCVGEQFDHNLHYAVSHIEDEQYGQNEIVEELQKGYRHQDKVIRASMVKVAN